MCARACSRVGLLLSGIDQIIENCHVESMVRIFSTYIPYTCMCMYFCALSERRSRLDSRVTIRRVAACGHVTQRCCCRRRRHRLRDSHDIIVITTRPLRDTMRPDTQSGEYTAQQCAPESPRSITCLALQTSRQGACKGKVCRRCCWWLADWCVYAVSF